MATRSYGCSSSQPIVFAESTQGRYYSHPRVSGLFIRIGNIPCTWSCLLSYGCCFNILLSCFPPVVCTSSLFSAYFSRAFLVDSIFFLNSLLFLMSILLAKPSLENFKSQARPARLIDREFQRIWSITLQQRNARVTYFANPGLAMYNNAENAAIPKATFRSL